MTAEITGLPGDRRLKRRGGRWISAVDPVSGLVTIFIVALVFPPILWLVLSGFQDPTGGLTLTHYSSLLEDVITRRAIVNTIVVSLATAVISTILAMPAAWAVARTDMPARNVIRAAILATFVTPPFLLAAAWILLAGPRAGLLNSWYLAITGLDAAPLQIFSMAGLIFVLILGQYPFAFIVISNGLESVSADMEAAARNLGASRARTAIGITLPLALPAVIGAFLIGMLESASLFGTPAILAIPSGFHVVATRIYAFFQYPARIEMAAALATPLLILAATLVIMQRRILGRKSYATITGKAVAERRVNLGRWRYVWLGYCLSLLLLSTFLPYAVLLFASLSRNWVLGISVSNFTFENFSFLASHTGTRDATRNSLILSAMTGFIAVGLASVAAYVADRRTVPWHPVLTFLAVAPIAIPGIAMATGVFKVFAAPPVALFGTVWILLIAYVAKLIPLGYMTSAATVGNISYDLERAARIAGASHRRTIVDIVAPLMRGGLLAGWALIFMTTIRELSSSILLFTPRSRVMAVQFLDFMQEGRLERASALGVMLLLITFATVVVTYLLVGANIVSMRSRSRDA